MTADTRPDVIAAVDLGSNSFHMVVARRSNGAITILDRIREMVRLGAGLDEQGRITPRPPSWRSPASGASASGSRRSRPARCAPWAPTRCGARAAAMLS
jgi:hypothetical protein